MCHRCYDHEKMSLKSGEAVKLLITGLIPPTGKKIKFLTTFDFSASESQSSSAGTVTTSFSFTGMVLLIIPRGS